MKPKLSAAMLDVLRAVDAGEPKPKVPRVTMIALWRRRLIEDAPAWKRSTMHGHAGWQLTNEGRLAVQHGRQMLTKRRPD